jgi:solute carrier family 50 protein (sugar transporter)
MVLPQVAAAALTLAPAAPIQSSSAAAAAAAVAAVSSWVQLCGQLAPVASVALFFAPLPTLWAVARGRRSAAGLPLLPYSSMVCNALLWTSYGILRDEPRIWTANAVGLVMGFVYVVTYLRHHPPVSPAPPANAFRRRRYLAHLQVMGLVAAVAGILAARDQPRWIGRIAVAACVVMFASPLAAAKHVLKTRNASRVPLPFTLASLVNCGLWTVSGLFDMRDPAVVVPNALGLASGTLQLVLKVLFASHTEGKQGQNLGLVSSPSLPPL